MNTRGETIDSTIRRDLPIGLEVVADIHKIYPDLGQIQTIFDVGANIGQTSRHFHQSFPNANIWSFEPIQNTFNTLKKNTANLERVRCFHHAFGNVNETRKIYPNEASEMDSFVEELQDLSRTPEWVDVKTINDFGAAHNIETIDLLKTDTEGWDLQVIEGASRYLEEKKIKFIYSEAGWLERDKRHTFFPKLHAYLIAQGFRMYALYDYCHHFYEDDSFGLIFSNALFVNSQAIQHPIDPNWG